MARDTGPLRLVARYPGRTLALVGLVTLLSASRIVDFSTGEIRVAFDPSTNALLPAGDESRSFYDFTRKLFGSDETILVALADDDVFTAENLRAIQRMGERIRRIEGVHHVVSLANALDIRSEAGDLIIEPFAETVPDEPAALARIRARALANPIYEGNIVSRDGRTSALLVYLMDISENEFLRRGIDRQIRAIAEEERGGAQVWITGQAYVKAEMSRTLLSDLMRTMPLATLALVAVALYAFRSLAGVIVPLTTVGIALVWTLAIFALTGRSLNVITVVLPPLILVVGFAYAVHVVSEYYALLREGKDPAATLEQIWLPVVLTGATTAVGFLSLALSPLPAIREFGLYTGAGVGVTVLVALTFGPAAMGVLAGRRPAPREPGSAGGFDRMAGRVARFDLRHRGAILLGGLVVALVSAYGVTRIDVSTDVVKLFGPETEVRRHFEAINESLGGSDALYVVLRTDYRDAFKEPVNLATIEALQTWLEEQPEIGSTTSVVDYVKLINRGFHDDRAEYLAIPASKELTSQLLFFGANDEIESFTDSRYQISNVLVRSRAVGSAEVTALVDRIERRLAELPSHIEGRVTGNSVLINRTSDDIATGQALSLSTALVIIYGVLCLLFMSFRVGFLALIPNALPVLVYFGALGWSGVTLNTTTGLVACLVLGIAVDDTIHFLARFNAAAKKLADESKGVEEALRTVGRPVTYTSLALCLGFGAIGTSSLQNQAEFGAMAAFTLAVAWLVDVVFTPALATQMRLVTLWDVLSLDLGVDPHRSIPLFEGLSRHQARIAALLTSLRRYPAGHKLMRAGEAGGELFVVIRGSLVASVPTRGVDAQVSLTRGDVVGEVGLFHGSRSADVTVLEDVELLRLTPDNLARLQRRYPRTGAQIYRNLSRVLAQRLAGATERMR